MLIAPEAITSSELMNPISPLHGHDGTFSQTCPTASSKRLLKGALLGNYGTFSILIPQSGQQTRYTSTNRRLELHARQIPHLALAHLMRRLQFPTAFRANQLPVAALATYLKLQGLGPFVDFMPTDSVVASGEYPAAYSRSAHSHGAPPSSRAGFFAMVARRRRGMDPPPLPRIHRSQTAQPRTAFQHGVSLPRNGTVPTAGETRSGRVPA